MMKFIEYGVIDNPLDEPKKLFARVDEDGLIRYTCLESDPAYQAWLNPSEGGTL